MIELAHISKRFGSLLALDDVSLAIAPGQILGLLGENGAGKSTLMNILAGLVRPGSGTICVAGRETRLTSPRAARLARIGMVHQHFKLVPTLTVLENLSLFLSLPSRILRQTTPKWLARPVLVAPPGYAGRGTCGGATAADGNPEGPHGHRPGRTRSGTAGSSVPGGKSSCLILDEPTAVLTPKESAELFAALRALRDSGTGIIFISHKLAEVRQLCDSIAILRRGKLVHTGPAQELSAESLAEKMVGSRVELPHVAAARPLTSGRKLTFSISREPLLTLQNISTSLLKNVSLDLRAGEILGIAGVDGNGQSQLAQAILGITPVTSGQIFIAGENAGRLTVRQRLDRIAFIAEDRHREALVLPLSIEQNLLLKAYRKPPFSSHGFLRFGKWRTHADFLLKQFDIRTNSRAASAGSLSGGNQQRVVLARELGDSDATKAIILAMNPTRGLDVGATAFVLQKLLDARDRGGAVLLVHSDLDELLAVSDRIAVLYNGTLTGSGWPSASKESIGRLMLGVASASPPMFPDGGAVQAAGGKA